MSLPELATRRRVTVGMLALTMVMFGLIGLSGLKGQPAAGSFLSDADRAHRVRRRGAA